MLKSLQSVNEEMSVAITLNLCPDFSNWGKSLDRISKLNLLLIIPYELHSISRILAWVKFTLL